MEAMVLTGAIGQLMWDLRSRNEVRDVDLERDAGLQVWRQLQSHPNA
jgi:hypothetical protein